MEGVRPLTFFRFTSEIEMRLLSIFLPSYHWTDRKLFGVFYFLRKGINEVCGIIRRARTINFNSHQSSFRTRAERDTS